MYMYICIGVLEAESIVSSEKCLGIESWTEFLGPCPSITDTITLSREHGSPSGGGPSHSVASKRQYSARSKQLYYCHENNCRHPQIKQGRLQEHIKLFHKDVLKCSADYIKCFKSKIKSNTISVTDKQQ